MVTIAVSAVLVAVAFVIGFVIGKRTTRAAVTKLIAQGYLVPNLPLLFQGAFGAEQGAGYAHQDRTVPVESPDDDDPASRLRPRFKSPEDPTPYL